MLVEGQQCFVKRSLNGVMYFEKNKSIMNIGHINRFNEAQQTCVT